MQETLTPNKSNSVIEILKSPFVILYNIIVYTGVGIKAVFFDFWVNIYNGVSYQVDKTYRHTKQQFMAEEEKIYEKTRKKPKKEKVYKYSAKTLANLERERQELLVDLQNAGATRSKTPHVYLYKAKDTNGRIISGTMNGLSKLDINSYLLNEGYVVYSIKTSPFIDFVHKDSSTFFGKKMSTKDLIFWLTQLSTYIKAGLTLNEAIKILTAQMKGNKARVTAFKAISYELTLGESFSSALEKQGTMFPALLINMIKAAEASGTLVETLDDMANYYTELDETRKQMVSAMTYPTIIMVFALAVIVFILVYVVPQFTEIYASSDAEITGVTKIVIDVSNFLKEDYMIIIGVVAVSIVTLVILYKTVKAFKTSFQIFLMHIPIVKDVIIYNEMTIFSKTFASLLRNNVFITDSMDILSRITNNEVYRAILYKTINNIVKGEKISEAFKDHWAVPDVAYYMIVTGESTGELANMMQKVSEYYQLLHKNIINNLKSFIEPIMISMLAVIVGLIIIAVIGPMFDMYEQIQ
ncbi:MAG TPA: type II secretion system F family protein [Candidatus Onthocola stercoravium]|nr:type II secretion system F family protein [Candidatus Onthocola stercoravium]